MFVAKDNGLTNGKSDEFGLRTVVGALVVDLG